MKRKNMNITLEILGLYLLTNIVYLLVFGLKGPLFNLINTWPNWLQIIITSVICLMIYIVVGYTYVLSKSSTVPIEEDLRKVLIIIFSINLVVFVMCKLISVYLVGINIWALYGLVNPAINGIIFKEDIPSWGMIISAIVPMLGLGIGLVLRILRVKENG